jgi:type III pantothenate kinase
MIHFELLEKSKMQRIIDYVREQKIQNAIISSVAENPEEISGYLSEHCSRYMVLNHITKIPVENLYRTKETLGKDRLAAVIGANYLHPAQNLLVIDAGSAITYDFINSSGQYLGGNIAPGIQMRYKALNSFTQKLPLVEPSLLVPQMGQDTIEAIRAGVQKGILYEVDGTINEFKVLYPDLKVLLTGGDIKYFDNKVKNLIFVVSNLVLIGLNRILNYNVYNK